MSTPGNPDPENPSSNTRSRSRNRVEEAARQETETPRPVTMAINIAGQNWQAMIGTYTGTIDRKKAPKFIDTIDRVKTLNGWDDAATLAAFETCVDSTADNWFGNYREEHPNESKKWKSVKAQFLKHFAPEAEKNRSAEQNLDDLRQAPKELVVDFHQRVKKVVRLNQDPRMVKAYNEATDEISKNNFKHMLDIWKQSQVENHFRKGLRKEIKQVLSSRTGMDTMTKMVAEAAQIEESQEKKTSNINELDGESEPEEEEVAAKKPKSKAKAKKTNVDEDELNALQNTLNKLWGERKKFQTSERSDRRTQYRGNGRGRGKRGRGSQGGQRSRDASREKGERFECFNCRRLGYHYASDCPEDKYEYPSTKTKTRGNNRNNRSSRTRVNEVDEDSDDGIESLNF